MERRDFIAQLSGSVLFLSSGMLSGLSAFPAQKGATVMTTTGPIGAAEMGFTLIHEHILSIFGTPAQEPAYFDEERALREVVPYLQYLKSLGCDTIVDCSAAYLGRNAHLLQKISKASGVQILISTGIYGAASDQYIPDYAFVESPENLADMWIKEFNEGIQGTKVRPGFLKSGVDPGPLSDVDARLVRAAALTHLDTGLLLQIHTVDNPEAANEQLNILKEEGVSPEAWVWVHAHVMTDPEPLFKAAEKGAWISLDGLRMPNFLNGFKDSFSTVEHHLTLMNAFRDRGLLGKVMLSHDGSSFPPEGTPKRPMDILFNTFIPMMKAHGYSDDEIQQVTVDNPARAFALKVRKD